MTIETEVKVFLVTRQLYTLHGTEDETINQLNNVLGHYDNWHMWLGRYNQIAASKDTQIMLLRQAKFSYKKIQELIRVSPVRIQDTMELYVLDYESLVFPTQIRLSLDAIESRFKIGGVSLW